MRLRIPFVRRKEFPSDMWTKCPTCGEMLFNKQLERNLSVCSKCGHHFRIGARDRIEQLLDKRSFEEHDAEVVASDPLGFADSKPYTERLAQAQAKTGLRDAAVWGTGRLDDRPVVLAALDFGFMGGSMGSVVGEKLARAAEHALAERLPLIVVSASGGARMQEGILSLMQMAKVNAALARLADAGIPYISIVTDPTTGGVAASFAAVGDIILAEPNALIGFSGARVTSETIGEKMPKGFQRAEFLLEHGFVDQVVPRAELRARLSTFLSILRPPPHEMRWAL
ncbi:MAG TPA: acetyl-CoA carboxylase, carboxyltransferase subunit beta [Candidatus Dormibacteraeota bacterium]|nr:acetyl-CoA carboxylase, carboxyltransferase subunit beta [Candidatus Dormibacteraeota bacterium]